MYLVSHTQKINLKFVYYVYNTFIAYLWKVMIAAQRIFVYHSAMNLNIFLLRHQV